MSTANALELHMLDLINADRAEAGVDALRIDATLNDAAEDHSAWMLDADTFSHTGERGSSATDRIREAGYELEGRWATGENIAWQSERGAEGLMDDVTNLHRSLMDSAGHRANILNPDFDEIGIGIARGDFESGSRGWDSVMVTQNFGLTSADDPAPSAVRAAYETGETAPAATEPAALPEDGDTFAFAAGEAPRDPSDSLELFERQAEIRSAGDLPDARPDAWPDAWPEMARVADLDFV